jgi:hypothetical protein
MLAIIAGVLTLAAVGVAAATSGSPPAARPVEGIRCAATEQLQYHVHARLTVFVHGTRQSVPAGLGIRSGCIRFLHTHAADGVIHVESPQAITFVLDQFFAVWGEPLDTRRVGAAAGRVTAFVDGRRYPGDPSAIPLAPHTQIQLDVGTPVVKQKLVRWPASL